MVTPFLRELLAGVVVVAFIQPPPGPPVQELAARSQMVFRATVKVLGASTVVADNLDTLAVVKLDEVIAGPPMLKAFVGRDITVRLKSPGEPKPGEQRIFFANPWVFADSLGVTEVGGFPATALAASRQTLDQEIKKAAAAESDRAMVQRLEKATLVVSGTVRAVKAGGKRMLTEHDPQWTEAELDVREVLKGTPGGARITMMFAASRDVMWYKAPKLKAGQEGVFLLSRGLQGLAADRVAVSETLDVLPASEVSRIRALLRR